ncbi:glycosyltransferase family 39 protein, partial [bacterium]|nr:glycosyltransferase family 39 protein [bacterium]
MQKARAARAAALALVVFCTLAATLKDYGVTFDEPTYYLASRSFGEWLTREDHSRFDPDWIRRNLDVLPDHNVHPSLVKWLGLPAFCPTLPLGPSIGTFRLGTVALVSIFFFALYLHVSGLYGEPTAFFASVLLFFTPRFFAHLHFAATDAPLTALWAWTFFSYRTLIRFDPWRPARLWATGILLGL